jgi:hypothetical protein
VQKKSKPNGDWKKFYCEFTVPEKHDPTHPRPSEMLEHIIYISSHGSIFVVCIRLLEELIGVLSLNYN